MQSKFPANTSKDARSSENVQTFGKNNFICSFGAVSLRKGNKPWGRVPSASVNMILTRNAEQTGFYFVKFHENCLNNENKHFHWDFFSFSSCVNNCFTVRKKRWNIFIPVYLWKLFSIICMNGFALFYAAAFNCLEFCVECSWKPLCSPEKEFLMLLRAEWKKTWVSTSFQVLFDSNWER